jgi:uncharacterized circularly permuted ATP-grasp superfamily protein/uncharacterized alpha-E superfamily protein
MTAGSTTAGGPAASLTAAYAGLPSGWDEMTSTEGVVRDPWREVGAVADLLGLDGLQARRAEAASLLESDGVTYRSLTTGVERPWELDPIPLLVPDAEWAALEAGLVQRAELLDAVLTDLYDQRRLISEGLLPPEVVFGHDGFVRAADQVRLPGPHQLFLAGVDLVRSPAGQWLVLGDRTQAPSGAGYAMENRRVVSRLLPGLYRDSRIQRLAPFFHAMRLGLQEIAPAGAEAPHVVLLTPGAQSETAFDQSFLSSLLGYPLVVGSDLTVRGGRVWARTLGRLEPVDVILRRVDASYADPLELRPDSQLGVPGLLEAARRGTVSIVNGIGSGAIENRGLLPFLPGLCRALLDQPLLVPSVPTWWCGDPVSRSHVRSQLEHLVVKPIDRAKSPVIGVAGQLSRAERDELTARIEAEPHAWVAQERQDLSTAPTVTPAGLEPRPVVLRSFAVAQGGGYRVLTGGLTRVGPGRVGPGRDRVVVSNEAGALAKDVWVLDGSARPVIASFGAEGPPPARMVAPITPRAAGDQFWLGRYAERAEDTVRLLRAVRDRAEDQTHLTRGTEREAVQVLLQALTAVTTTWPGFAGPAGQDRRIAPQAELLSLTVDRDRPGTIAYAVHHLTEVAAGVREQLSLDTWLVLGGLERELRRLGPSRPGAPSASAGAETASAQATSAQDWALPSVLNRVLEGLLALTGLTAESLVRDAGWLFMDAGRRLERAIHVVALLRATVVQERAGEVDALVVETVLGATESIVTFRRRNPARAGVASLLDLVLTDRENPRSVAYQVDRLQEDLTALGDVLDGSGAESVRDGLLAIVAQIRQADAAALAVAGDDDFRAELDDLLGGLSETLGRLALSLERAHFQLAAPPQPYSLSGAVSW